MDCTKSDHNSNNISTKYIFIFFSTTVWLEQTFIVKSHNTKANQYSLITGSHNITDLAISNCMLPIQNQYGLIVKVNPLAELYN